MYSLRRWNCTRCTREVKRNNDEELIRDNRPFLAALSNQNSTPFRHDLPYASRPGRVGLGFTAKMAVANNKVMIKTL